MALILRLVVALVLLGTGPGVVVAAGPSPAARASAVAPPTTAAPAEGAEDEPVILFVVDNSASLPPLDPSEQRVAALQKVFTFLEGQRYRLVLFGGKREISVDDPMQYANTGQWTDFYFVMDRVRQVMAEYPAGADFRIVLLTDGLIDPDPAEWPETRLPAGPQLREHVSRKTVELVGTLGAPLYVILVGKLPDADGGDAEKSPALVLQMVRAANGDGASERAQKLASFLSDDGALLKKFIYRVEPHEGLRKIEPVVRRIVSPAGAALELQLASAALLPLTLFLFLLLGLLVRSFPGPGDAEIIDIPDDAPVHVAADKVHKVDAGGWGSTGLSLVADIRQADATFEYKAPAIDLGGAGLDTSGLDEVGLQLLQQSLDDMRQALSGMSTTGTKEEKIYALNLDYVARRMQADEAAQILATPLAQRRSMDALDFLRAKAHLAGNTELRRDLVDPRVHLTGYGKEAERKDLAPGTLVRVGSYGFVVKDVTRGGRKDIRVVLLYARVPSLLGLKNWVPDRLQQIARFRRSSLRLVN